MLTLPNFLRFSPYPGGEKLGVPGDPGRPC